jgi:hypothetical protein
MPGKRLYHRSGILPAGANRKKGHPLDALFFRRRRPSPRETSRRKFPIPASPWAVPRGCRLRHRGS